MTEEQQKIALYLRRRRWVYVTVLADHFVGYQFNQPFMEEERARGERLERMAVRGVVSVDSRGRARLTQLGESMSWQRAAVDS